jgi:cytochrome c
MLNNWVKFSLAILITFVVIFLVNKSVDIVYSPQLEVKVRGYKILASSQSPEKTKPAELDIPALMAKADAALGQVVFKKCAICHDVSKGGPNKVGPNLWDIVGNKKGHLNNFPYSKALLEKGGQWGYTELFSFLNLPRKYVPGTKMSFAGLKNPEDIANVIAYLRTLSDSPLPLPSK